MPRVGTSTAPERFGRPAVKMKSSALFLLFLIACDGLAFEPPTKQQLFAVAQAVSGRGCQR